jgi:hypothetical protein
MSGLNPGGSRSSGNRVFGAANIAKACQVGKIPEVDKRNHSIADLPHKATREQQRRQRQQLAQLRKRNPLWTIAWEYGFWTATHDNFDASYEGEEDGFVGNGWNATARDLVGLEEEMREIEEAKG